MRILKSARRSRQPRDAICKAFHEHFFDAGVGSISEIFDAEEPFRPGGCIAQAWSVAEVLRAWLKTRASVPHAVDGLKAFRDCHELAVDVNR